MRRYPYRWIVVALAVGPVAGGLVSCKREKPSVSTLGFPGSENLANPPGLEKGELGVGGARDGGPQPERGAPPPAERGEASPTEAGSGGVRIEKREDLSRELRERREAARPPGPDSGRNAEFVPTGADLDVVQTLERMGGFSTFLSYARRAGMVDALRDERRVSLLAPTDEAFASVPEAQRAQWERDPEALKKLVRAHMLAGQMDGAVLLDARRVRTIGGVTLDVVGADKLERLGAARVARADVVAKNGIVHVVRDVIPPPAE